MTAKELKAILSDCPDDTVIAIVSCRGFVSRSLSLITQPFRRVYDNGKEIPHLFIYEGDNWQVFCGLTPQREIDDLMYWEAEKKRRAELEAKRQERKTKFINFFKRIWTSSK